MKKIFILFLAVLFTGYTAYTQVETGSKIHYAGSSPLPASSRNLVQCGPDTIIYPYVKELVFTAPNDSFFIDAMVGNVRTASQGYVLNDTAEIIGVQFWGGKYSLISSPPPVMVRAYLYAVNSSFMPVAALDSVDFLVGGQYDFYEASFPAPHTYNQNFSVAVKLIANDTLAVMTNNAGNSWSPDYSESLSWRRFGSGIWNSTLSFFGQDLEYMIFPIVSYRIHADMDLSGDSICAGETITFTNTSSPILNNHMFNLNTFDDYWSTTIADSTFHLNFGDSPTATVNVNTTHVYSGGNYTATLTAEMTGYYNICRDSVYYSIHVGETYSLDTAIVNICNGNTYNFGSQTINTTGFYNEVFTTAFGCDSNVVLNLTVDSVNTNVNVNNGTATAAQAGATYQWIDCNLNTPIASATSQSYSPAFSGYFAAIITQNGCTDTSSCVTLTVGLENPLIPSVNLYPTPTNGDIIVNTGNITPEMITITNMLGKTITILNPSSATSVLDISSETNGIYIVQVRFKQGTRVQRIVKY